MLAYTVSAVHKLYTSQLIAVMVKFKKIKRDLKRLNMKMTMDSRLFIITSFTLILNSEKIISLAQFAISSRSVGVPYSQKRNRKRVKKNSLKRLPLTWNLKAGSQN